MGAQHMTGFVYYGGLIHAVYSVFRVRAQESLRQYHPVGKNGYARFGSLGSHAGLHPMMDCSRW